MAKTQRRSSSKSAAVMGSGLGSGIVLAWAWNQIYPEASMPAEVASAIGGGLVLLASWINDKVNKLVED